MAVNRIELEENKMKKLIAMLLTLAMVLSLAACGAQSAPTQAATEAPAAAETKAPAATEAPAAKEIKVGIAAPDVTHGWVAGVAYYAEKYCKENNLEYMITTSKDAASMTTALDDLVAWGATVIVSWPQWTGMETALQNIIDSGIPVVNFDVDVDCQGIYKVTGDNYDMGYQSAKYIVEKAGEAAHIVVLDVPSSGSVCELRKQGFYAYLDEISYDKSNIKEYQLNSFAAADAQSAMADILEANPQIDAIFSMDDETSIGTLNTLVEAGRTDVKAITGGGGCQAYFKMIADEAYATYGPASALYSPNMVEDAIETAIKLMNGETGIEPVVVIPTTIVSAENVADYLDENNTVY